MIRVVVALAVAVVVGAAAMPVTSVGIGWLISALAALGVAVAARTLRGRLEPSSSAGASGAAPASTPAGPTTATAPGAAPAAAALSATPAAASATPAAASATSGAPAEPAAPVTPGDGSSGAGPSESTASAPAASTAVTSERVATPSAPAGPAITAATPTPATAASVPGPAQSGSGTPAQSGPGTPDQSGPGTTPPPGSAPPAAGPVTPTRGGRRPETTPPTRGDRIWRWAAAAAALVLVAVPAVRASEVLLVLCLLAALPVASYALVGGRTWASVLFSGFLLLPGAVRGVGWLATHRLRRSEPGGASDSSATSGPGVTSGPNRTSAQTALRVGGVVALTLLLVMILVPLLRSADPVFANLIDSWLRNLPRLEGRSIVGGLVVAGLSVPAAYYAYRGARPNPVREEGRAARAGLEWLIPVAVVDLIFAVFVVVQVNVLFGGHDYVLGAGGPDYADYARSGFGQLCLVTLIALALAAGLGGLVRRQTRHQRVLIRVMGGLLCLLTLVIVASALKRMLLYVDAYGFTWLRLLSFSFEVFLGLVFVLLLVAGIRLRGAWLPRATAAVAVGVLLALVAVNPEAVMARTTIEARLEQNRAVDLYFLGGLSADAVDEILRLPPAKRDCVLGWLREELAEPDEWYEVNLARAHARSVLAAVPAAPCLEFAPRSSDGVPPTR